MTPAQLPVGGSSGEKEGQVLSRGGRADEAEAEDPGRHKNGACSVPRLYRNQLRTETGIVF